MSCLSTLSYGTTRLPLEKFLYYCIFECFTKICKETSSSVKTGQKTGASLEDTVRIFTVASVTSVTMATFVTKATNVFTVVAMITAVTTVS